ncbi:unnamed protein product [Dicrocoelium dendriticum]|nr:unnamed protein product [Dicrocoelium dendriticum]
MQVTSQLTTNIAVTHRTAAFDSSQQHCLSKSNDVGGGIRDKATLLRLVEYTVRTRMHHIDKNYKHYDHQFENMLSKKEFGELLIG